MDIFLSRVISFSGNINLQAFKHLLYYFLATYCSYIAEKNPFVTASRACAVGRARSLQFSPSISALDNGFKHKVKSTTCARYMRARLLIEIEALNFRLIFS